MRPIDELPFVREWRLARLRIRTRRNIVLGFLTALCMVSAIIILLIYDSIGMAVLFCCLIVAACTCSGFAASDVGLPDLPEERPDTPEETAVVISSEIFDWSSYQVSVVRVVAEVEETGDPPFLVYAYIKLPFGRSGHVAPGTRITIRRFPDRTHWVHAVLADTGDTQIRGGSNGAIRQI